MRISNLIAQFADYKFNQQQTTVTLWGDFAENYGAFLDKLKDVKPILGLCDVRKSIR